MTKKKVQETSKQENINEEKTNAKRFIDAYNDIDYALKVRYSINRSMGFSDLIRKAVVLNYIIRKNEDNLIDYGRLRNAIVHNSNEDIVIAEPHMSVVEDIERIAKLLTTPPKALDTVARRDVLTVSADTSMYDIITLMATSKYSNLPVYDGENLIGIANGQKILDSLGQFLLAGGKSDNFLNHVKIEDMLSVVENSNYYTIAPASITVEEALNEFHNKPKLLAILITKDGNVNQKTLGIVTGSDVVDMNKILELY